MKEFELVGKCKNPSSAGGVGSGKWEGRLGLFLNLEHKLLGRLGPLGLGDRRAPRCALRRCISHGLHSSLV